MRDGVDEVNTSDGSSFQLALSLQAAPWDTPLAATAVTHCVGGPGRTGSGEEAGGLLTGLVAGLGLLGGELFP